MTAYSDLKKKWMKDNTTVFTMRLSYSTDKDIIEQLKKQESKQGYIKRLIRDDIAGADRDGMARNNI